MSDSLWLHGLQHARHPCPSPSPIVCSNSCPLSQLCHPTISSSVLFTLLLLPSIFPSIRVFSNESTLHIRWPNYWSFSFSISPSNEYSGLISFRVDWFDLLLSKGLSRVFSSTTVQKQQFFGAQPSLWPTSHICAWQEKYQQPQIYRWYYPNGKKQRGTKDWSYLMAFNGFGYSTAIYLFCVSWPFLWFKHYLIWNKVSIPPKCFSSSLVITWLPRFF